MRVLVTGAGGYLGRELVRRLGAEAVLMTLGEDGMCLCEKAGRCVRIPTVAQAVFDVAGAGDTVIGVFTTALAIGASLHEAAVLANHAAGIVVGKVGVATASPQELLAKLNGSSRTQDAGLRMQYSGLRTQERTQRQPPSRNGRAASVRRRVRVQPRARRIVRTARVKRPAKTMHAKRRVRRR